jgi:hypothetical protein
VAKESPEPPEPVATDVSFSPIIVPGENPTLGLEATIKF